MHLGKKMNIANLSVVVVNVVVVVEVIRLTGLYLVMIVDGHL